MGVKASLSPTKWNAQWQQNPTSEEVALIKRDWWRTWEKEDIPPLSYILQSFDTAFSKKETADYTAITTWGVFDPEEDGTEHIILLDAKKGRFNFPELKDEAMEQYDYWEPDMVLIEAKASGMPLADELLRINIPVTTYSPGRRKRGGGVDKTTRMHMVAPIFEAGRVWAPDEKFAEDVIEECAAFPNGEHDDLCDSMTMALIRFREGSLVVLEQDEDDIYKPSRKREYY